MVMAAAGSLAVLSNQSNVFMMPFLHQLMSQSAVQKPGLNRQTASNAGVEAQFIALGQ
jgi:hypothetical protein